MKYIVESSNLEQIRAFYGVSHVGLDVETTSLDPICGDLRTIQISHRGLETLVIDVKKIGLGAAAAYLRPLLEDKATVKILHNAKFDCKFIKQKLDIDVFPVFDSMLSSLIINAGASRERGYHGLAAVAMRYAKIALNKEEQLSDWSQDNLSESQLKYAALDAECLEPLREALIPVLKAEGLVRTAKLEFDTVLPLAWLELCGFYLDFDEWMGVANANREQADLVANKIYEILAPYIPQQTLFGFEQINLNSQLQVKQYFELAGVKLPDSTKAWLLEPMAKEHELVKLLLEYRGYDKAYTSFGEKFHKFINPKTGRIHADFMQIGAETGRLAVANPNTNQIPQDGATRGCFKAEKGNVLVSNDYSQIELRILADLSKDRNAIKAFSDPKTDFHMAMASIAFKKPVEKVTPEERTFAKRLNFGIPYGIGVSRFSMQCGILETEGRVIMDEYFKAVPQEKRWLDFQKMQVLRTRSARTASGRLARYEFEDSDSMSRSKAQRNACNHPIQGTAADIMKRSLKLFYDQTRTRQNKIKLVNIVHDEINLEVEESMAEEIAAELRGCMIDACGEFLQEVAVKVDTKIGRIWKK